jgi:Na+/proline symporter
LRTRSTSETSITGGAAANSCPSSLLSLSAGKATNSAGYALALVKVTVALSVLVVVLWGILIATWPADDAQIGISYLFLTFYAIVALVLIWLVAVIVWRRAKRNARW